VSSRLQMRCSKVGGLGAKEAPPNFHQLKVRCDRAAARFGSVLPSPTPQLSLEQVRAPLSFHPVTKTNKQLQPAPVCNICRGFSLLLLCSFGLFFFAHIC
jgi:hypothetical protein